MLLIGFTCRYLGVRLYESYLCAQLLTDNRLFHFWKSVTKGKHLWLRNNGTNGTFAVNGHRRW